MDHGTHGGTQSQPNPSGEAPGEGHGGWKHWGLMVLCCAPMIAIFLLITFGIWSW